MEYITFCLAAAFVGIALSLRTTWEESMNACATVNNQPSSENDVATNNTWLGKAKYEKSWGVIVVQIQRIEENETCSDCGTRQKDCKVCMSPVQVNKNGSSFEELKTKLTPGQKYIIRDSWSKGVEGIPEPATCLVHRGASYSEYVSCNNSFYDGCNDSGGHSPVKVIIYIEENNIEGTTTYTSVVSSHVTIGDKNGKSDCFLPDLKNIFIVVGFCCILIITNVLCVCCCVNYEVKRKLRSLRIQQMNDSPCKPISEAITRIYKSINAFDEEQNKTYDLAASVIKKSSFAISSAIDEKDNYDKGFFRLLTQSGDYDMAWPSAWSSPTSPDVEYDHVQNVGTVLTACLPEEEIYSKQRPLIQDISCSVNKMCKYGNEPTECVSEKSTESINGLSHEDEKNSRLQTVAKFQENDQKNIVGNGAPDKGTHQKQNIVYEEKSGILQKELSMTDEVVSENGKTKTDKKARKGLETGLKQNIQNGKKDVNVKKAKVHIESKPGNACNSLAEYPYRNEDTMKTSSQRAGKMVDKATSILVANMNKVLSETKL